MRNKFIIENIEPEAIEYLRELSGLIEALHSAIFGVHALKSPEFSHEALSDNGQIHILVHHIIRALPSKLYLNNKLCNTNSL